MISLIRFPLHRDTQILLLQYVFIFIPQHWLLTCSGAAQRRDLTPKSQSSFISLQGFICPVDLLVLACAIMDKISVFIMEAGGMLLTHKQEGVFCSALNSFGRFHAADFSRV